MAQSGLSKQIAEDRKSEVINSNELSEEDTEIVVTKLMDDWKVVSSKLTEIENILAPSSLSESDTDYNARVIRETKRFIGNPAAPGEMFSGIQLVGQRHPLAERLIDLLKNSVGGLEGLNESLSGQTGGAGGDEVVPYAGPPTQPASEGRHPIIYKPRVRHDVSISEKCVACIMVLLQLGLVLLLMWVLSGPLQGGIRIMELSTKAVEYADRTATQIGSTLPTCTPEELNDPILDRRADGVYTYRTPDQEVRWYFTTKTIPGGKIVERCMERSAISSFFSQGAGAVSDTVNIAKVVVGGVLGVCSCGMATFTIVKVLDYIQRYCSSIVCQILALTALMNGRINFNGFRIGMEVERQRNLRDFQELQGEFDRQRKPQVSDRDSQQRLPPVSDRGSAGDQQDVSEAQSSDTDRPRIEGRRQEASQPITISLRGAPQSTQQPTVPPSPPLSLTDQEIERLLAGRQDLPSTPPSQSSSDAAAEVLLNRGSRNSSFASQPASPGKSPRGGGSYTKSKSRRKYKRRKTNQIRKKTKRKRRRRRTSRK